MIDDPYDEPSVSVTDVARIIDAIENMYWPLDSVTEDPTEDPQE